MCLWLITACLGMLPTQPSPVVLVPAGVPAPILTPTTTTMRPMPPMNMTGAPTMPTTVPTAAPTPPPTVATTVTQRPPTMAPTAAPTAPPTMAPTMAPTMPPTMPPTMAPTVAPTAAPTMAPPATAPPTTTLGAYILSVLVCNNPNAICVSNPDDNTGTIAIDPRLGSSPPPSAALQVPQQIRSYNAQLEPLDSAVKFPREKRSTGSANVKEYIARFMQRTNDTHKISKRQTNCRCVPTGTCATNGAGMLDVRIVTPGATTCPAGQVYCCGATIAIACGTLQTVPATATAPAAGQARFGEFPWQALVLTKQNDYLAGGVLIDQLNVLTVTHRLVNYVVSGTAPNVKVRLGEWDAAVTTEPVPFQEFNVAKVFTHPMYNPTTLQYDLTVLRLAAPVPLTPAAGAAVTVNRACLPASSTAVFTGQRCYVAGWGKDQFGMQGEYQQIMKKVDVPVVAPAMCQAQLQAARLGPTYLLDTTSFMCAGSEANKDACTGDGGSGLVCNMTGSWALVGLVSWGLGCANANVPGVYVNVAALLPWIQQQVATP